MQFTDISFLFLFLPLALVLYYAGWNSAKPVVLLVTSLFFYACGSKPFFLLLCVAVYVNVGLGGVIGKAVKADKKRIVVKGLLAAGILGNVALLFIYKYIVYTGIPLGVSYFTFKAISYLVDVYNGKTDGTHRLTAAVYLSFWGHILAGPIARYESFENRSEDGMNKELFANGCMRFMVGFSKKILLANVLNNITSEIFATEALSTSMAWLGAICYSLQLFYDFAGYSDMAIGISGMFGIVCPENFVYPYTTKTISEFWRRWHITLGSWFRDYVYIPLGGSRVSKKRIVLNLFVVWLLTGIWHGAGSSKQFVVWGLLYFIAITIEKLLKLPERVQGRFVLQVLYRIGTLLFINFLWVIFGSNGLREGMHFIRAMVTRTANITADRRALFLAKDYAAFIATAIVFTMPVIPMISRKCGKNKTLNVIWPAAMGLGVIVLFIISVSFVVGGLNNPFVYVNF